MALIQQKVKDTTKRFEVPHTKFSLTEIAVSIDDVVVKVAEYIASEYKKNGGPVRIFGYSRGAVVALYVAHLLNKEDITVEFLGLIDPVPTLVSNYDNQYAYFGELKYKRKDRRLGELHEHFATIPGNVTASLVVYADPKETAKEKQGIFSVADFIKVMKIKEDSTRKGVPTIDRTVKEGHISIGWSQKAADLILDHAKKTVNLPMNP